jgi:hypothetical protein
MGSGKGAGEMVTLVLIFLSHLTRMKDRTICRTTLTPMAVFRVADAVQPKLSLPVNSVQSMYD